ncbi:MAG: helix-turn-helix transcriptional regulator [Gemmatimonadaceae bacterium]
MAPLNLRRELALTGSRGRIVEALRRGPLTVLEIAAALELTGNAVRTQLAGMERDGLVRRSGVRRGPTRPAHLYVLTPELQGLLSGAYVPLLRQVVRAVAANEPPEWFDALMREAGRALADEFGGRIPAGPAERRVAAASRLLNQEFGALTHVEPLGDHLAIQGSGCPLAALTDKHPSVCHAIESMLAELLGASVKECCDRAAQPRCCFEVFPTGRGVAPPPARSATTG